MLVYLCLLSTIWSRNPHHLAATRGQLVTWALAAAGREAGEADGLEAGLVADGSVPDGEGPHAAHSAHSAQAAMLLSS